MAEAALNFSAVAPKDMAEAFRVLDTNLTELKANMDQFFLIIGGMIIFFMQPGFAFLEAGAVRSKNTTNILIKNLLDVCIGGVVYWLIGYGIAFGNGNPFFGNTKFASVGLPKGEYAKWFFQFVFASTSATIVSGSMVERCQFSAYLLYTVVMTGVVYPACSHWAWSDNGWLVGTAFHDFAGSSVVHITGGAAALIGCLLLGPRVDRVDPETGKFRPIRGHSVPFAGLGGFILIFGFLAFNGASQGRISEPGDGAKVSQAVMNTIISGCCGGMGVLFFNRFGFLTKAELASWSFLLSLNGTLTAMVAICAGCNVYPTWAAVVVGFGASLVFLSIHHLIEKRNLFDDPLDAVAVHLGGGFWGMIATGLFSEEGGLVTGSPMVLAWNLAGALSMAVWSMITLGILFGSLKLLNALRVSEEDEIKGMDAVKHQEPAYPVESWMEEQYTANGSIFPLGGASLDFKMNGKSSQAVDSSSGGLAMRNISKGFGNPAYNVVHADA